jgi:hypothetical protein
MMKPVLIICFVLSSLCYHAQFLDSLHDVFNNKSSIDARLESRNSFINNQLISVTGLRLGVAYQKKLRVGGGISWMKSNFKVPFYKLNELGKPDTLLNYLKFMYLCYYIDFVFYKTKRWQLSVPIQAGTGLAWYQAQKKINFNGGDKKSFLLIYEPGITVQFKIFKYIGLGSDVAYRFTLKKGKKIGEFLNSPTYSFKVLIWFDQAFYSIFPNSKVTKKYGPSTW